MTTSDDALDLLNVPDRIFYELGVMLDKEDFRGEQLYHRGRLARALAFLHGAGTVAGLKVEIPYPPSGPVVAADEEVRVHPGVAIDEVGRLVEIPTLRCTRLSKWIEAQAADTTTAEGIARRDRLLGAFHTDDPTATFGPGAVVIDVFLRFAACDRGKTPAFATGPFDALDAVQPSRVRDGFELQLVPRPEAILPVPTPTWPPVTGTPAQRRDAIQDAILGAWEQLRPKNRREEKDLPPADKLVPDWLDFYRARHLIFLARLRMPCTRASATAPVVRVAEKITVDNRLRPFIYTTAAALRMVGDF